MTASPHDERDGIAHDAIENETVAASLRRLIPDRSWNQARALCRNGKVFVDGERALDPAARLRDGQRVTVYEAARRPRAGEHEGVKILHEDPHLVVIRKPPHLTTAPRDAKVRLADREATAFDATRALLPRERTSRGKRPASLFTVHRLDKETSGILCFARSKAAERALHGIFKGHHAERRYSAVVYGKIGPQTIHSTLIRDRGDGLRGSLPEDATHTPRHAQEAVTHIERAEPGRAGDTLISHLRLRLETGRTHQIRIHLAEAGHPVVGERVYVRDFRDSGGVLLDSPRLLLHAETLAFVHPMTGEQLEFRDPPGPEFEESALAKLQPTR